MAKLPEEQNIKSKARRRLIGSIALALAVVVILPMVLDSEPKSTGQDIDLRIPASDKVGEFVPGAAISEVAGVAPLAESAVVASPTAVSEVPAVHEAVPTATASGKITVADAMPVIQTAAGKQPEIRQAEIKKPEVKLPEVRQAKAKTVEKAVGTYIVQTGAFANAGTATQEADKLKAWGFKAYIEQISGTTRVRIGPYADKNKADEVRLLLEKHGQHPVVTVVK